MSVGKLDRETLVPLGIVGAIVATAIGAAMWLQGQLLTIAHEIKELRVSIEREAEKQRDAVEHQRDAFEAWVRMLKASNPSMVVPEPWKR